jgi:hypothetical protein
VSAVDIDKYREERDFPEKMEEQDFTLWLKELILAGYDVTFHWMAPFSMPRGQPGKPEGEFVSRRFRDLHSGCRVKIWKTTTPGSHYMLWAYRWCGGDWWQRTNP